MLEQSGTGIFRHSSLIARNLAGNTRGRSLTQSLGSISKSPPGASGTRCGCHADQYLKPAARTCDMESAIRAHDEPNAHRLVNKGIAPGRQRQQKRFPICE
jgi:hypothetical protein